MKKFLSVLLSVIMAASPLSTCAFASEGFSTADALTVLRASAGLVELTEEQKAKYDMNGDGTITSADALAILRVAAGLPAFAPAREALSEADIEVLTEYIRIISGKSPAIGNLPAFDSINDVPLTQLLQLLIWIPTVHAELQPDAMYSYNRVAELTGGEPGDAAYTHYGYGYSVSRIDKYFKELLNPGFSIAGYDYKNYKGNEIGAGNVNEYVWDGKNDMIVIYGLSVMGGGGMYGIDVTDAYKSDGSYFVHATVTEMNSPDGYDFLEAVSTRRFIYTFTKNDSGNFNIVSKQQA
ncbi:MAG: dockerin type I repeat-containing protein [Oscillospiraceae bacterium]|nr:dockerin type I repeat-containing protein [Oscillospiraceae bacterium]